MSVHSLGACLYSYRVATVNVQVYLNSEVVSLRGNERERSLQLPSHSILTKRFGRNDFHMENMTYLSS